MIDWALSTKGKKKKKNYKKKKKEKDKDINKTMQCCSCAQDNTVEPIVNKLHKTKPTICISRYTHTCTEQAQTRGGGGGLTSSFFFIS